MDEEDFAPDLARVTEKIHSATEAALASKENSNRRIQSQQWRWSFSPSGGCCGVLTDMEFGGLEVERHKVRIFL
jgi:hypothetical protein